MRFQPEMLTVDRGDTIVWVNKDLVPHTATSKAGNFDSKLIQADKSWKYTIRKKGTSPTHLHVPSDDEGDVAGRIVKDTFAPGWPGIPARWTSSAKSGLGTAVSRDSRVWFTLSHGILNEIYYPRVDHACTRDLGFIVTDGQTFFSEEKRDARSETLQVAPGIPAYRILNTAVDGRYRIEKEVLTDPWRDVVLQRVRFVPLRARWLISGFTCCWLPPRQPGSGNTAWVGDYKGAPMLLAERDHHALALASTAPWLARSAGFVGVSDGWQELRAHKRLNRTYTRAENGNVAVTGEIDLGSSNGTFVMALGFGPAMEAGQHALISLLEDFDGTQAEYVRAWKAWHARLKNGIPRSREARCITPVPRCYARTNPNAWKAGSLPACRSHGASPTLTTTWAAITWCGPETSWRRPVALSRWARTSTSGACCDTSR